MPPSMTAWQVLEEWRSDRRFIALVTGERSPHLVPTPDEIARELIAFIFLADTNLCANFWQEVCAAIDGHGDSDRMRLWFLAGGKELFEELLRRPDAHGRDWLNRLTDPNPGE